MSDVRPILLCAQYRADSPVAPMSVSRRCEKCFCLVMTSPSSATLIAEGAMVCCAPCGEAIVPVDGEYDMLPGQLDELARLLGPWGAIAVAATLKSVNDQARRGRN